MNGGRWISLSRHKSLKSRRLDLFSNHEICFQNFSFSSRNWRKLQISWFFFAKNLVPFSNQKTYLNISKFEIWIPYFPFSSWFHFLASPQCLTHGKIPETCYTLVSFLLHELLEYLPPLPPRALKRSKPPLFLMWKFNGFKTCAIVHVLSYLTPCVPRRKMAEKELRARGPCSENSESCVHIAPGVFVYFQRV